MGSKMVDAIMKYAPRDWIMMIDKDISNGFWNKMRNKYSSWHWTVDE